MFGRDAEANKLTLLTPNLLNLTAAAKIQLPALPSSFVFVDYMQISYLFNICCKLPFYFIV